MSSPLPDIEFNREVLVKVLTRVRSLLKDREIVYLDMGSGECITTWFVVEILKPKRVITIDIEERFLRRCSEKALKFCKQTLTSNLFP
jgi:spermidine synthase